MTAVLLLKSVCEFLTQTVSTYAAAQSGRGEYTVPRVFEWDLPFKNSRNQDKIDYPFVVARLNNGEDAKESPDALLLSRVQVDLVFGVYSEGEDPEGFVLKDGAYDLMNIMEHVRQSLQRTPLLDKQFRLEKPYKWHIPDEQPYPLWVGFAETIWSIQSVLDEQNGGFLHGHKFEWEKD